MTAVLFSFAAFAFTFLGGMFALKFNDRLHYILSFTAGVLLGVVCFDLLPEIFGIARDSGADPLSAMIAVVAGFLLFHSLEKFIFAHHVHDHASAGHGHPEMGTLSASALIAHSFMDGAGIGLAYQASPAIGLAVGLAVIAHDFCDGLNTVSLMLANRNTKQKAVTMLLWDAAAPVLGALSSSLFILPQGVLMIFLGFFAGFLLYIAAAEVLPEAHNRATPARSLRLVALTAGGAVLMYAVVHAAG